MSRRTGSPTLQANRAPGASPFAQRPRMPPGATRSAHSNAARHPAPSLAALMGAPERRNMPHLHPRRLNGSLWFDIHDCIRKDIVATWQAYFSGPWWNFKMVDLSRKEAWWSSFVQKYYWDSEHQDAVFACWTKMCKDSIGNLVSKRKRSGKRPHYIGESDWNLMLEAWDEEPAIKRSKTNGKNRTSNPDGLGMHSHTAGAKKFGRIAYEMALEAGGVEPAATEVVRKTHTRKDGSFVDKRAETLVAAAENLATERSAAVESDDITQTGSTTTGPTHHQLKPAYLDVAKPNKGRVYGLGSMQYLNDDPNESAAATLRRNLDTQMQFATMKEEMNKVKDEMNAMKRATEMILRANGIDPSVLQSTGQPTTCAEATPSAPNPATSPTRAGSTPGEEQPSPINLAEMTPQSVEGYFEERH